MAFNNSTPIVLIRSKINFNVSVPSSLLDPRMIYYYNNPDVEEETQMAPNDANILYVTINNVSSSFNVKMHLNLRYLALNGQNVEYKREQKQLFMKLRKPPVTAIIQSSGKILCVGSPSEYEAKIAARRVARIIQRLGYHGVQFSNYKIINVLGSCMLPFFIRLTQFSEKYKSNAQYEPELNPGVMYKIKELKATLTVYSTGSITVIAQSEASVRQAIEHIYPLVLPFGRSKLLDGVYLTTEENQAQRQNIDVDELNENHQM